MASKFKKIKRKWLYFYFTIVGFVLTYYPVVAFADPRADAEKKLKTDFKDTINAFTNVFQYLGYAAAVLAVVINGLSGLFMHDEESIKRVKKITTWVIIIAVLIGIASTIVTLATNTNT